MCTPQDQEEVSRLLQEAAEGRAAAVDELFPLVYGELRRLASAYLNRERAGHTLQTTALVNEAYLKLADQRRAGWKTRAQFLGIAAQAMRRILVDHARARKAAKRGGGQGNIQLDETVTAFEERAVDLVALDAALERLRRIDERKARVVELRFFGGLTVEETADVLGIGLRTVDREWVTARAWLRGQVEEREGGPAGAGPGE
jgi:RNA polymerase sigma factor (TIGR02999 family)